jgi:hypothetical protein
MCFQCTILVHKTYQLLMNDIFTISIIKSWDAMFVMYKWSLHIPRFNTKLSINLLDCIEA